ncbi:MAG: UDP-N-acetylglucosamine acyltransferase [Phycisphaerales bacterium]|jgi:UDP-N-acetylglucosamine acyltransferase
MPATTTIHPSAIVSDQAQLAPGVELGPNTVIEGAVKLGEGVRVIAGVYLRGPLTVGAGTVIWPGACLGCPPQDYKFGPDDLSAGVVIGENCIIREHATVHAATNDHTPTTLGDKVFMMATSHVGHDGLIDDEVILVNGSMLGGHVHVAHKATVSGGSAIHQFCRLGRLSFVSGGLAVSGDVPPFCAVHDHQRLGGINLVGLRRNGIAREEITAVRQAFRECFWKPMMKDEQLARLDELGTEFPCVAEMAEFVRGAKRHILPGSGRPRSHADA